jgi:allophanate hydrolase subunit 2
MDLDSRADRMGIRLLGTALQYQGKPMISEGIPLGAVQVPPDGQPIVLLNDRQTIGGYPRLGALTPLALARLAQCLPGAQVRLRPVVQDVAHREHIDYLRRFSWGRAGKPAPTGQRDYLDRNRIPSSSPRKVSGYIWSSIKSRTMLVEAV